MHTPYRIIVVYCEPWLTVADCRRLSVNIECNAFCNPFNTQIRFSTESNNGGEFPYDFCLHKSTFCLRRIPNNLQALDWTLLLLDLMQNLCVAACNLRQSTTGRHANTHATTFIPTLNIDMMMLMMMAEFFPRSMAAAEIRTRMEKICEKNGVNCWT